mgnify:CR=1 FL=1
MKNKILEFVCNVEGGRGGRATKKITFFAASLIYYVQIDALQLQLSIVEK